MPFSIHSNIDALSVRRHLASSQVQLTTTLERLSSGLRINQAGDDAAGLAISEKLRAQVRGMNNAARNAQDGISFIQAAENALGEQQAIVQRMRELAVEAANDTFTTQDRQNIQTEIDELIKEIDRLSNTTEFNTKLILKDYAANPITLQIGANTGQVLGITITASNSASGGLAISGLTVTSHDAASNAIASLDYALSVLSTDRAKLGAIQNRLEFTVANLNSASEKLALSESRIRDSDVALETINLTRLQILQQAGIAAQAQANLMPQAVLSLLT
jgi:flagellin